MYRLSVVGRGLEPLVKSLPEYAARIAGGPTLSVVAQRA